MRVTVMFVAGVNTLTTPFALGLNDAGTKLPKVSILLLHTFCAWSGRVRRPSTKFSRNTFFTGAPLKLILSGAWGIGAREQNYLQLQNCCQGVFDRRLPPTACVANVTTSC